MGGGGGGGGEGAGGRGRGGRLNIALLLSLPDMRVLTICMCEDLFYFIYFLPNGRDYFVCENSLSKLMKFAQMWQHNNNIRILKNEVIDLS